MDDYRREALLKEYGEVSSNFRLLTDIRFKLLAFLPIAAAAGATLKGETVGDTGFALLLFGLVTTIGLVTYNARNDQLYDTLVRRAASIERSLGLSDGAFANRPRSWLKVYGWKVDHRTGVNTIYSASIALWLFRPCVWALGLSRVDLARVPYLGVLTPLARTHVIAFALAVTITWAAAKLIKVLRCNREKSARCLAAQAVNYVASRELLVDIGGVVKDDELIKLCARLSGAEIEIIRARAAFLATLDAEAVRDYLPRAPGKLRASQLVAILTDFPPGWLFDCATDRLGEIARDRGKKSAV